MNILLGILTPIAVIAILAGIVYSSYKYGWRPNWRRVLWYSLSAVVAAAICWYGGKALYRIIAEHRSQQPASQTEQQVKAVSEAPVHVYDFTKERAPKTLTIKFYKDKWVGVNLPVGVAYRTSPDSDVLMDYPGLRERPYIDGPGRQNFPKGGRERAIFRVNGLEKSGEMKIALIKEVK